MHRVRSVRRHRPAARSATTGSSAKWFSASRATSTGRALNGTGTSVGCPGGCSTSDTWLSTVRGRIGYSFDRVMPYVTGGLAVGDIRAATPGFAGGTSTNAGWTLGAGLEVALPGNWTAKAEYLRVDLGSFNCTGCSASPPDNVSLQENVFRAGVNYHFGWGK